MDSSIVDSYSNIFHLLSGDCKIVGLKYFGKSEKNESEMPIYRFMGIIRIPTLLPDVSPTENELTEMKKFQHEDIFGPDIFYKARWKDMKKGKPKVKSFVIRGQLTPHSILSWEIFQGNYYIKMELYGNFN